MNKALKQKHKQIKNIKVVGRRGSFQNSSFQSARGSGINTVSQPRLQDQWAAMQQSQYEWARKPFNEDTNDSHLEVSHRSRGGRSAGRLPGNDHSFDRFNRGPTDAQYEPQHQYEMADHHQYQ